MESFVIKKRYYLVLTFCDFRPKDSKLQGGDRGQNVRHLGFFCFYSSCMESLNLNNRHHLSYFSL